MNTINNIITDTINDILNVCVEDEDANLLSTNLGIGDLGLILVLDSLKRKLSLPIFRIIETHDYRIVTINNLSAEIEKLSKNIKDCID